MRKFWFAYMAKALVVFPGGFGTLDEMFEPLTLAQTEKLEKQIQIILYGSEHGIRSSSSTRWSNGARSIPAIRISQRADTPKQAFELLREHLTTHHLEAPEPETKRLQAPQLAKTRR